MRLSILLLLLGGLAWWLANPGRHTEIRQWLFGQPATTQHTVASTQSPSGPPRPAMESRPLSARTRPGQPSDASSGHVQRHKANETGGNACKAPPTLSVNDVQSSQVYRFVNKNGVVSFSDRQPMTSDAHNVSARYRRREQYFRINILHDQAPDAVRMQSHIMADTQQIFRFLARHLDVTNLRQVYLDLRLLPTAESFSAYRKEVAPELDTNSGFYMPSRNEAVVRLHSGRNGDHRTLKVVRHETSHLIAAALFGRLPKWLNEGLAEYFERMDVEGHAMVIQPSAFYLRFLRNKLERGQLPPLSRHLHLSTRQWLRLDQSSSYGIAWSLVYYLMSRPEGRHFLGSLLDAQAGHRCRRFDTAAFVDGHYQGGIAGLEREWRQWLRSSRAPAQYF